MVFSIDLWREVAARGGLKSEFKYVDTLGELLEGIKTGKAQAAIAAITITKAREADLDFSHSYFHSGLQVLIANKGGNIASKVWSTIVSIITSSTIPCRHRPVFSFRIYFRKFVLVGRA